MTKNQVNSSVPCGTILSVSRHCFLFSDAVVHSVAFGRLVVDRTAIRLVGVCCELCKSHRDKL